MSCCWDVKSRLSASLNLSLCSCRIMSDVDDNPWAEESLPSYEAVASALSSEPEEGDPPTQLRRMPTSTIACPVSFTNKLIPEDDHVEWNGIKLSAGSFPRTDSVFNLTPHQFSTKTIHIDPDTTPSRYNHQLTNKEKYYLMCHIFVDIIIFIVCILAWTMRYRYSDFDDFRPCKDEIISIKEMGRTTFTLSCICSPGLVLIVICIYPFANCMDGCCTTKDFHACVLCCCADCIYCWFNWIYVVVAISMLVWHIMMGHLLDRLRRGMSCEVVQGECIVLFLLLLIFGLGRVIGFLCYAWCKFIQNEQIEQRAKSGETEGCDV